ncbi:hypothetical protein, partial [Salmonella enterica]|uniref:hypothetical protein n=1 Tax=Salmonella enterica TaxID=28901 RepID=UPI002EC03CC7|nr:hypothetical protein [Salmonella enterica subsp. enterica serovar Paratyphi A]
MFGKTGLKFRSNRFNNQEQFVRRNDVIERITRSLAGSAKSLFGKTGLKFRSNRFNNQEQF